jgi:hypothetical protein
MIALVALGLLLAAGEAPEVDTAVLVAKIVPVEDTVGRDTALHLARQERGMARRLPVWSPSPQFMPTFHSKSSRSNTSTTSSIMAGRQ